MKNTHFWILRKILKRASKASLEQVKTYRILGETYGQYDSMENWDCRDGEGREIPWYTYPAIEYLDSFDLNGIRVLEYGSGNSSIFYLNAGAEVTSIENDKGWFDKISASLADKPYFTYFFEQDEAQYVERDEIQNADIVVIDGRYRNACARFMRKRLQQKRIDPVMIVFDNSDRHPDCIALLDEATGWNRCDFNGFGPINSYTWTTSVYLNPSRQLSRKNRLAPIGGLGDVSADDS
ncbi:hypothetical protein [Ruegeria arenilitoris]|uniref:hypothetical protein n=1 Tax=Ruegeria arenilitoris TaxID=1173585 RepID=UPI00147AB96B|nr:hypothetical protein [Ruegeria arenilitoris]